MAKTTEELREVRKQWLPTVTTFSPRDSQSNLSSSNSDVTRQSRSKFHFALAAPSLCSPLGLPKELPSVTAFSPRDSLSKLSSPLGLPKELPSVTAFSPRDSLSKLSSPLGLPKEFAPMEQKLKEMHTKEDDRIFSKSPVPFA